MKQKVYVTPKEAQTVLGVSVQTLRNWEKEGKIQTIRTPSGHRRYDISSIERRTKPNHHNLRKS